MWERFRNEWKVAGLILDMKRTFGLQKIFQWACGSLAGINGSLPPKPPPFFGRSDSLS